MITVTIEQSGTERWIAKENSVTKRTPTDKKQDAAYGNKTEVCFVEEFAVVEVEKSKDWSRQILKQQIQDESKFDLAAVIKAVNSL